MATIAALLPTSSLAGGHGIAAVSSGRLYVALGSGSTSIGIYYSDNGGSTWTALASATISTGAATVGRMSLFADANDVLHLVYTRSTGGLYYHILPVGDTAWATAAWVAGLSDAVDPDVVAFYVGGVCTVAIVYGASSTGVAYCASFRVNHLTRAIITTYPTATLSGPATAGSARPSIDFYHTGDGKTLQGSTPYLYVAWYALSTFETPGMRFIRGTWTGIGWSWGTTTTLTSIPSVTASLTNGNGPNLVFDGVRCLIALATDTAPASAFLVERNAGDTATTVRAAPSWSEGNVWPGLTVSYDFDGNAYLAAIGATSRDLFYAKYTRAGGTWSAWTAVHTGATLSLLSAKRGVYRQGVDLVYYDGTNGAHARVVVNKAPNTPLWTDTVDVHNVANALTLDWSHNDPDGDPQTKYQLDRSVNSGAWTSWNGTIWTTLGTQVTTSTTQVTIPAGSSTLGVDADQVDYRVATFDGVAWSPLSATRRVFLSAQNNPTITAPTSPVGVAYTSASWTVTEQIAKRVSLYDSTDTVLLWTEGWETSTVKSRSIDYGLVDGASYVLHVQTQNNEGLQSTVATQSFTVDYVEPAVATVTPTPSHALGKIAVVITNPTPTGLQPAVVSNELWVRVAAGERSDGFRPADATGIRIATGLANNATFIDWAAASNTPYQYRVRTFGVNGTMVWSAWSSSDGELLLTEDGVPLLTEGP